MTLHENGGTNHVKLTNKKANEKPEESKTQQLIGGSVKPEATARTASTQRCCGDGGCVSTTHMKWKPGGVGANGSVRTQMKCLRALQTLMRHTRHGLQLRPSQTSTTGIRAQQGQHCCCDGGGGCWRTPAATGITAASEGRTNHAPPRETLSWYTTHENTTIASAHRHSPTCTQWSPQS